MSPDKIFEIAPCLKKGPLSKKGFELIEEVQRIPKSKAGDIIKTLITYRLFVTKEEVFKKEENPTTEILASFQKQTKFVKAFNNLHIDSLLSLEINEKNTKIRNKVENETASFYGALFQNFDADNYFNEATDILKTRLKLNEIYIDDLNAKTVLDAGCGGGKYSVAWKNLGAKKVIGVDFSETVIKGALDRIKNTNIDVEFKTDNVLDLSYENNSFDILFCNGVLHHINEGEKGIFELVRVLKKGGLGWLYVIEKPGGYFWDIYEILRVVMHDVDKKVAEQTLKLLNLPAKRIFRILDHVMVPVNIRWTKKQVLEALEQAGAINIKRLKRGMHFDRIEIIHNQSPFAEMKYGIGENIFVFSK